MTAEIKIHVMPRKSFSYEMPGWVIMAEVNGKRYCGHEETPKLAFKQIMHRARHDAWCSNKDRFLSEGYTENANRLLSQLTVCTAAGFKSQATVFSDIIIRGMHSKNISESTRARLHRREVRMMKSSRAESRICRRNGSPLF